jgi:hypothetical protein
MGTEINYLYGDSTPSALKINFIALVCDVFDFAVDVLLHDAGVGAAMQDVERLSEATEKEIAMAEELCRGGHPHARARVPRRRRFDRLAQCRKNSARRPGSHPF